MKKPKEFYLECESEPENVENEVVPVPEPEKPLLTSQDNQAAVPQEEVKEKVVPQTVPETENAPDPAEEIKQDRLALFLKRGETLRLEKEERERK